MKTGKRTGFTLIELLVVIAVIAVLSAILFPAFANARARSRQIACLSNARQLGIAVMTYVDHHDDTFLPSTNYAVPEDDPRRVWPPVLAPYAKGRGIFVCPEAEGSGFPADWSMRGIGSIGYTTMASFDPEGAEGFTEPLEASALDEPARIPLFGDTPGGPTGDKYRGYVFDPLNGEDHPVNPRLGLPLISDRDLVAELSERKPAQLKPLYARHLARGNNTGRISLIFADGHAKSYGVNRLLDRASGPQLLWRFRLETVSE
jgi:prepilin-type N-terminal cleavage/methylation domain-containing protein